MRTIVRKEPRTAQPAVLATPLGLATNQTGAPVEGMLHYPFGQEWQNSTGFGWDEKFAQLQTHDADLSLYMTTSRLYKAGIGRWLTPDKLGGDVTNPQSLNRYAYVLNNPATLNDPLGLDPYDGGPGGGCSDPAYADSNARCGTDPCWGLTPEEWSQSNCSGLPGVIGGGSGGGGSVLPPVPPAGQPPLAGGPGAMGIEPTYPPTGTLPWPFIIHVNAWGLPYLKGVLLASFPYLHTGLSPVADHPNTPTGPAKSVPTSRSPGLAVPSKYKRYSLCVAGCWGQGLPGMAACAEMGDAVPLALLCGGVVSAKYNSCVNYCKKVNKIPPSY